MSHPDPPADVLRHYPGLFPARACQFLGNRGGFSGAWLWRVETAAGAWCLRAWPVMGPGWRQLITIHRHMRQAHDAGLSFVPQLRETGAGTTWVEHAGRLWDVTSWLPGRANYHDEPTDAKLTAAGVALARLHAVWSVGEKQLAPSPAIGRRMAHGQEWQQRVASGWRPEFRQPFDDPVQPWAERAWRLLPRHLERLPELLAPWLDRSWPVQPCLCDIWHDHLLFTGDQLTGLVDYGSVRQDHVAVDLARMLGSLVGDDPRRRDLCLTVYSRLRPLRAAEEALMHLLDVSGVILGAANWLKMLYVEPRHFEDRCAVARRLAALTQRLESWE
ncbi:MAG: phosphotransferase enzyme family protein [Gemmataceae bacterium]